MEPLALLRRYFDAALVERAADYVREQRVHMVKLPPWPVVARVRGDDGYVVTVFHDAGGDRLRGECSCAVGADCEHAAATALVALQLEHELSGARAEAAQQDVVGEWLAELGRHQRPADTAPASGAERVVAYVIDVRDGEPGLTVMQATALAKGGLGAGTLIAALGDPQRGAPSWVETDDLRRIALLRAVTRVAPGVTRMPLGRLHGELLEDLAASGRLFWDSTRGTPLRYGPPRAGAAAMARDGAGDVPARDRRRRW